MLNVEYAPVTPQALLYFKLHESRTVVVSSTVATMLGQLVMFVFDNLNVVEKDRLLLLASELESITLLDGRRDRSVPQRATRSPSSRTHACCQTASVHSSCSLNISTKRLL
jgi:hypothetical protein